MFARIQVHLRQNPTHTAAPVLNEDGSVPMDGSGDFEVISRRGRPRGPRATRRMARPRISRPPIAPLPPTAPTLPLSMASGGDPVSSVQYPEQVRGPPPPPVMSGFHVGGDDGRRIDGGMFPLLPPAFGADFIASQRSRHGNPFQTNSSSGFQMRPDNAGQKDDRPPAAFSTSSSSLYLPVRMDMLESSMVEERDDRRCRSYSPSKFEQHPVPPIAASAQSQASSSVLAPATACDDYGVSVVSSPMPEPEPALCGDLPLDLTAKARMEDAQPETSDWSPPDDITAYRPRRHYETWKQGSSLPRPGEPAVDEKRDSGDVNPEVGVAEVQPEPEIVVERAQFGEPPTETVGPPAKRGRLSTDDEERVTEVASGSPASTADSGVVGGRYQCSHCEIEFFSSRVLHAMHMAFHGPPTDPFQCSQCGARTADRVEFFLHLARAAHS